MRGLATCLFILVTMSLAECAERASEQESDRVIRASISCMASAAEELDDHKSDAVSVAYGILGRCSRELMDEYATAGKGFNFDNQQSILFPRSRAYACITVCYAQCNQ